MTEDENKLQLGDYLLLAVLLLFLILCLAGCCYIPGGSCPIPQKPKPSADTGVRMTAQVHEFWTEERGSR